MSSFYVDTKILRVIRKDEKEFDEVKQLTEVVDTLYQHNAILGKVLKIVNEKMKDNGINVGKLYATSEELSRLAQEALDVEEATEFYFGDIK